MSAIVKRDIAGGDGVVFKALKKFVTSGHELTVLIGNHDIELSLPDVRDWLDAYLGRGVTWLMDSEAYAVGDAVIEHGNAYDVANAVDHARLRLMRAAQPSLRRRRRVQAPRRQRA